MTLGSRLIVGAVVTVALTVGVAVAGASSWRWALAALASVFGLGLAAWTSYQLRSKLGQLVRDLSRGTNEVSGAASQIASSSQSLAQGSSEQASTLTETSASSDELNSMTQKNAESARLAADVTQESERLVESANSTLAGMVSSMEEINHASDKIARIIKVIDEIAFQTNILALNAAVEAARAGEAGMGFAVVADEVRSLAQRSAQAAKDTAAIIEESISRSEEGRLKLDQVKDAIAAITESTKKVRTLVDEVSVASQDQAKGIAQISQAISQMEQVTQRSAASAEESASAGEELSAQASAMTDAVVSLEGFLGNGERAGHSRRATAGSSRKRLPLRAVPGAAKPARNRTGGRGVDKMFPMDEDFR